jgi:hypothetical protein
MNERIAAYLRENVATGLEMMIRDGSTGHVFDVDADGLLVFVMAVVPKAEFEKAKLFTTPSAPLRAETPVQRETKDNPGETI